MAAQRWQVDAGVSGAYEAADGVVAASLGPQLEWQRPDFYALFSGNVSLFEGSSWMAQVWGDFSYLTGPLGLKGRLRVEGAGSLGGSLQTNDYRSSAARAEVRAHGGGRNVGGWVGLQASSGWTSDTNILSTATGPTLAAWTRRGPWQVTAIWSSARLRREWVSELETRVFASLGPVDLSGFAGWREGNEQHTEAAVWTGASVAYWLGQHTAVVLAGGSYPRDLLQNLSDGRYLSAAVRLANRRPPVWTAVGAGRPIYAVQPGTTELRFVVPGPATRVELVGDWTRWKRVPLVRGSDGRWVIPITLAPGVYRFNLVVDGKRWIVPEGVAEIDDGFGGKTAVLVVP